MTNHFDADMTRLIGELDNVPPAQLPGPVAARKRGESRTRHQAIGGTFTAVAVGAVAAAIVFGQPSFLAGPDPADPTPTEEPSPQPAPTALASIPDGALLSAEDIWDYGGTELIDWYQHDIASAIYECVPDLGAIEARDRKLVGYTNSPTEGDPNPLAVVVHDLVLLEPDTAVAVLADLREQTRECAPMRDDGVRPAALDDSPVAGIGGEGWILRYLDPIEISGHPAGELAGGYVTIGLVRVGDILSMTVRLEVNTEAHRTPDYMTPGLAADKVCLLATGESCVGEVDAPDLAWYPVTIDGEEAPDPAAEAAGVESEGWEVVPAPQGFEGEKAVVAADGAVVVFGGEAGVWLSSDGGSSWIQRSVDLSALGGTGFVVLDTAVVDDGTLVAVGSVHLDEPSSDLPSAAPLVLRSTDNGMTWTAAAIESADAVQVSAVTWTGDAFVAVGTGAFPTAWTSPDGVQWTHLSQLGVGSIEGDFTDVITGVDGNPIALNGIGDSTYLVRWIAEDESRWEQIRPRSAELSSFVITPSGALAVGYIFPDDEDRYDSVLLTSSNGVTWEIDDQRSPALGGPGDQFANVIKVDSAGRIVVAGSDDGAAALWIAVPDGPLERAAPELFAVSPSVSEVVEGSDGRLIAFGTSPSGAVIWREIGE